MKFYEDLPSYAPQKPEGPYAKAKAELMANPGMWGEVAVFNDGPKRDRQKKGNSLAMKIRTWQAPDHIRGVFTAAYRTYADGTVHVFGRYTPPIGKRIDNA